MKEIFALLTITFCLSVQAQLIEDDSYLDAEFVVFKSKLVQAVNAQDSLALSDLMADTIFGIKDACGTLGCSKEVFFSSSFQVRNPSSWEELSQILRFGFKRKWQGHPYGLDGKKSLVFQAPSYLEKFDYGETIAILAENVNVRKDPSTTSEIIGSISYDTVSCNCQFAMEEDDKVFSEVDNFFWVKIILADGRVGYVAEKLTSNVISKEISIGKVNGEWKIISISPTMFC